MSAAKAKPEKKPAKPTEYVVLRSVTPVGATDLSKLYPDLSPNEIETLQAGAWLPVDTVTASGSEGSILGRWANGRPGTFKLCARRAWKGAVCFYEQTRMVGETVE